MSGSSVLALLILIKHKVAIPEIRNYAAARKILEEKFLHLGSAGHSMKIIVFSGEQSYLPSRKTVEVFEKYKNKIEKIVFGGGPGISIKRDVLL